MAKPSQVTDEIWDDHRVKSFLELQHYVKEADEGASELADFHVLLKAYRGMRPEDFERFLVFFTEAKRNLDARDKQGRTLWQIIDRHRHAAPFISARKKLSP